MRILTTFLFAAALVVTAGAQTGATKKAPAKKTATEGKEPPAPTIPTDATPVGDGSFRYVDKEGKKWIYRKTPFGVSKAEERPAMQPVQQIADEPTKSEDLGETVPFSRPTPFGAKVWVKKKSELDGFEKSIVERDQQKNGSASAAPAASKPDSPKQD